MRQAEEVLEPVERLIVDIPFGQVIAQRNAQGFEDVVVQRGGLVLASRDVLLFEATFERLPKGVHHLRN